MIGIPVPVVAATVLIAVEFLGGIALILGLATRWVSLLLAFDMFVAILAVHRRMAFQSAGLRVPSGFAGGCDFTGIDWGRIGVRGFGVNEEGLTEKEAALGSEPRA